MAPITLRLSWRTWVRWVLVLLLALVAALVALTDDPAWYVRMVSAVIALAATVAVLDVLVFVRSWDVDGRRWWVPTLLSRGRVIPVDERRVVELRHTYPVRLTICGDRGERDLVVSPLVSVRDLDRWFDEIAG